ncbi:MAG: 4'-phosphopantetheinyl transferase [Sulfuricurvum sp. MLSB]|uniref:holo-ACP synthase n=1 Tax=unclassified Sulfuricurvum TaxID=2632390 RepID=UPI0005028620|nr:MULTISPECIES: holo-ACP synthase [unclassified Sulfuricurvum]KFN40208.1 MAG: 4'-phosphopantetheinyl transferase [Sulfuricurvum sp. MLSB]
MIGIDLIKTDRMKRFVERFGDRAIKRVLSENDIHLYKNYQNFAGLWAAKEACAKALGCGIGAECGFHDIILSKSPKGAPLIDLSSHVKTTFGIGHLSVSITHDGDYAIAVVALEKQKA